MDEISPEFHDPLATMLGYQLRRASVATMNALAAQLDPLGIRPSDATMLMLIGANPGCTQSDIGRALRAQPANLVPLVNKLVAAGAIARERQKGRAIALTLTADGARLYREVEAVFAQHEARIARGIPRDLCAVLVPALMRICRDACREDAGEAAHPNGIKHA